MSKTTTKPKTKSAHKKASPKHTSNGVRPSVGIIFTLTIALFVAITISVVALSSLRAASTELNQAKLAVFDHLAESYIRDMEYTANDKPTINQITGYGISDEDGVLYFTFDFVPYDVVDYNRVPDGDMRHGIIYFWEDKEHNTYGHAFSYHDDASYHPAGTYVRLAE